MFTPLIAYVSMFNTLAAYERQFGASTIAVRSRATIKGHDPLILDDVFAGDSPILGASTAIAGPLTMLLGNDIEPITIESLDVTISSAEVPRRVTIERVWLDDIRPRAGRTTPLKILTKSFRGEEKISTIPIEIPANASGRLSILVSDGRQLNVIEQRDARRTLEPQTVTQLLRLLNDTRRNNRVYVRLLSGTPGAVVNGEAHGGVAAVGPVGARERPQRRQFHADAQRHGRRMGAADGLGGVRVATADDRSRQRFRPLMDLIQTCPPIRVVRVICGTD